MLTSHLLPAEETDAVRGLTVEIMFTNINTTNMLKVFPNSNASLLITGRKANNEAEMPHISEQAHLEISHVPPVHTSAGRASNTRSLTTDHAKSGITDMCVHKCVHIYVHNINIQIYLYVHT